MALYRYMKKNHRHESQQKPINKIHHTVYTLDKLQDVLQKEYRNKSLFTDGYLQSVVPRDSP